MESWQMTRGESIKEPHQMSFEEFTRNCLIINVQYGRGKTGTATTGKQRAMITDVDDLYALRAVLSGYYPHDSNIDKTTWVNQSITNMLSIVHPDVNEHRFPDGRHVYFVFPNPRLTRQAIYKTMIKLALESGLNVPESVAMSLKEDQSDVKTTV